MLQVFPFSSGSLYTASYAISSSYASEALLLDYVSTSSFSVDGKGPRGFRGKDICLITADQYFKLLESSSLMEVCTFPPRDT